MTVALLCLLGRRKKNVAALPSGRGNVIWTSSRSARPVLTLAAIAAFAAGCSGAATLEPLPSRSAGAVDGSDVLDLRPGGFLTPAEASDYERTAGYAETRQILDLLADGVDPRFHVRPFGTTVEGREMPLVVWGTDSAEAEAIRRSGKTRVLVIGGIHAGEPAGKDAMLALLRDLVAGQHAAWADSLVLVVAPIYNADGAERIAYTNRPLQWGPLGGMGVRPNAQGLDLNRDFVKAASPEAQAMIALIRDLDPHVVLDLHTTDGTPMGYHLTYAPGLSPNTPAAIDADLWDRWLPSISDSLLAQDDYATYHYGNVPGAFGEEATAPRGWYSFSAQPRFSTNYVGLRGRYAILSEAYSYAPFQERVDVSRRFVEEVLDRAWSEASLVRRRAAHADEQSVVGREQAVRTVWAPLAVPVEVLLGRVDTLRHPVSGEPMLARRDIRIPETMPAFVRFEASESVVAPQSYVVLAGPAQAAIRDLLDLHGVRYTTEPVPEAGRQRFVIDSLAVSGRPFQNVAMQEVFGTWRAAPAGRADGALVVPVAQPLGRLAVALLEPRSEDGVVAWAVVPPQALAEGGSVPIERIPAP